MQRLPKESRKTIQRKQAAALKKKAKKEQLLREREVARQAQKTALNTMAEEVFGEEGLTPQNVEALSKVVLGPDGGKLSITSAPVLRKFINHARKKFAEHAEDYVRIHHRSVMGALNSGEFETAARHAEWAMEALGDSEERLVERAPKVVEPQQSRAPVIQVGVALGGMKKDEQ